MITNTYPYFIALAGPAGVGKSTIATHIEDSLLDCTRTRFAEPLKQMLRAFGLTHAQVDGDCKERPSALLCGRTPRHAMRTLGTQWGRELIGEDVWVNAAMWRVDALREDGRAVVIDDCRFDNEAQAVRKRGGIVVKLTRHGVETTSDHASEAGIRGDLVDYIIANNEQPQAVAEQIIWLVRNRHAPGPNPAPMPLVRTYETITVTQEEYRNDSQRLCVKAIEGHRIEITNAQGKVVAAITAPQDNRPVTLD